MDAMTMVWEFFVSFLWLGVPLLLIVIVGGGALLLISNNPDLLKQHPFKVRLWRKKGMYLCSEARKARYDTTPSGLKFFKIKGLKHLPIPEIPSEYQDPEGWFNLKEIRKGILAPMIISDEVDNYNCPVVMPRVVEVEENGVKKLKYVMQTIKVKENGKDVEKQVPIYEPTGEFTQYAIPVEKSGVDVDDNTYLMLNLIGSELGKNEKLLTEPNILERNKEVIMFVTACALSILLIIVVVQQGLVPTIASITSTASEVAKANAAAANATENTLKLLISLGKLTPTPSPGAP